MFQVQRGIGCRCLLYKRKSVYVFTVLAGEGERI